MADRNQADHFTDIVTHGRNRPRNRNLIFCFGDQVDFNTAATFFTGIDLLQESLHDLLLSRRTEADQRAITNFRTTEAGQGFCGKIPCMDDPMRVHGNHNVVCAFNHTG